MRIFCFWCAVTAVVIAFSAASVMAQTKGSSDSVGPPTVEVKPQDTEAKLRRLIAKAESQPSESVINRHQMLSEIEELIERLAGQRASGPGTQAGKPATDESVADTGTSSTSMVQQTAGVRKAEVTISLSPPSVSELDQVSTKASTTDGVEPAARNGRQSGCLPELTGGTEQLNLEDRVRLLEEELVAVQKRLEWLYRKLAEGVLADKR